MKAIDLTLNAINADALGARLGPDRAGIASWSMSRNTRFVDGVVNAVRGELDVFPGGPSTPILAGRQLVQGGVNVLVCVVSNGIWTFDGAWHNQSPAGFVAPELDRISTTVINGLLVVNAPPNEPYFVPLTGGYPVATKLPGWVANSYCNALVAYRYYLVAVGITEGASKFDQLVRWSVSAEPGALPASWTPLPENDAGDLVVAEFPGELVAARPLGDALMLYKHSGTWALNWVGGQGIMARRLVFPLVGVLNQQAVVNIERAHVLAVPGDLVMHDGATSKSLLEGRFRNWFKERVQPGVWGRVTLALDSVKGEVWCAYPVPGSDALVEAVVWSRFDDSITVRDISPSNNLFFSAIQGQRWAWSDQTFSWANSGGKRWSDQGYSGDGSAMLVCLANPSGSKLSQLDATFPPATLRIADRVVYAERVGIPVGPLGLKKLFKRVRPRVSGQVGTVLAVQIGAHDEISAPVKWQAAQPFTIGQSTSVPAMVAGRFAAMRFEGTGRFAVEGFSIEYTEQGAI